MGNIFGDLFDKPGCLYFDLTNLGTINLDFNPAFLSFDEFDSGGEALVATSFFNVKFDVSGAGPPSPIPLSPDLVARIFIDEDASFDPDDVSSVKVLTGQGPPTGPPKTVWPNEALVAPDGVFPFEALVVAQGFLSAPFPGRLTAINVTGGEEYIIDQSVGLGNLSRAYHNSLFYDMDGDGLLDIISVRTGERVFPQPKPPTAGELVWFKNPGLDNIQQNIGWEENILVDGLGPDIDVKAYDLDGDGVPEFIATHFFTGDKITIYGVGEFGKDWSSVVSGDVDIRSVDVSTDQGKPFGIEIVDLDGNGRVDILATNHQTDNCAFPADIPGRVYAIIPPIDNDALYDASQWTTRILLDDIYPQPSLPGARSSRLAPGKAVTFYPSKQAELENGRPWIVVGGDEAGKVWILRPSKYWGQSQWSYSIHIIFDINDFYGSETTQTYLSDKPLITISTIGSIATRYDRKGDDGMTEIYIPVFEAQDIHVFSFRDSGDSSGTPLKCLKDKRISCPADSIPGGGPLMGVRSRSMQVLDKSEEISPGIYDCDTWNLTAYGHE